jgi:hypothetical protein
VHARREGGTERLIPRSARNAAFRSQDRAYRRRAAIVRPPEAVTSQPTSVQLRASSSEKDLDPERPWAGSPATDARILVDFTRGVITIVDEMSVNVSARMVKAIDVVLYHGSHTMLQIDDPHVSRRA